MATHFVLNTGAKIPSVGLGTWQSDPGVVGEAIYAAVKVPTTMSPLLCPPPPISLASVFFPSPPFSNLAWVGVFFECRTINV